MNVFKKFILNILFDKLFEMDENIIYVASNQNVTNSKKAHTHPMVIYKNYLYWWAEENKKSTRYTCSERSIKKCGGSITIADKVVIRSTCHTGHNCLNDNQVKILIKGQELKKMVESNSAQTVQELLRAAQDQLVADNVPDNVVAADFSSLLHQSSGLHKRRAKTLPSVPKNFVEMDINGQFALTTAGMPFLRYDNKSEIGELFCWLATKP